MVEYHLTAGASNDIPLLALGLGCFYLSVHYRSFRAKSHP